MSSEVWRDCELGEIAKVKGGKRLPKGLSLQESENAHPYIRVSDMGNKTVDSSKLLYVPDKIFPSISQYIVRDGDIILSIVGTIGLVTRITSDLDYASLTENCVKITNLDGILDEYLYYYLISEKCQNEIKSKTVGTTQPKLPIYNIVSLHISVPPVSSQHKIADILSSLDEKIELNRQTNATLEAIAQAIFKEWFVDFNYPGATGELVDSELGLIPKGWSIKPLDEIADFLNGLALQKFPPENETEYLPVIKIRELRNGVTESSDRASRKLPDKYIVKDGDLLFSWSGSLEVKFWVGGEGALNQHLFKVTSKDYPLWFCYHWILHHLTNFRNIAEEKTTTMGHIKREHLTKALCSVPDSLGTLEGLLSLLHKKMMILNEETNTLIKIRDSLLPKLMRPRIRE